MTSSSENPVSPATAETGPATITDGMVMVACDGAPASQESLFNAARLAGRAFGGPVELIGVCEPTPGISAGMLVPAPVDFDEMRRQSMMEDIHRTVSISDRGDPSWSTQVMIGSPARVLASESQQRHASLLIMGIGRHNPLDRLFGTETTLSTLRESSVPVLAVGMNFPRALTHVIVGMDFSAASLHAGRLAIQLLGNEGRITLVHVRPKFEHPSSDWQAWDADYGRTLPPLFESARAQLHAPDTVLVETVTLRGDPAPALLAYAQQNAADLIALGTQRHSFIERLVVGSVATRVLRTTRCSVLAVPVAAVPATTVTATETATAAASATSATPATSAMLVNDTGKAA